MPNFDFFLGALMSKNIQFLLKNISLATFISISLVSISAAQTVNLPNPYAANVAAIIAAGGDVSTELSNLATSLVLAAPANAANITSQLIALAPNQSGAIVSGALKAAPAQLTSILTAAVSNAPNASQLTAIINAAIASAPTQLSTIVSTISGSDVAPSVNVNQVANNALTNFNKGQTQQPNVATVAPAAPAPTIAPVIAIAPVGNSSELQVLNGIKPTSAH
jgi:hypothetical protein